jgi:imidazolonepropionase-like amidohydrolase
MRTDRARHVMRSVSSAFFLLLLSAFPAWTKDLAIAHVTVIDCTGSEAKKDQTVIVHAGRIAQIGRATDVDVPKSTRLIDGKGKFLIPGLWDMHGHLTDAGEASLSLLIMNGVTGVRDMGGDLDLIDRWRSEIAAGKRVGPQIVRAGPFVDGPKPGAKNRVTVTNETEARQAVDKLKERGVDFIKVHNGLSREAFFAVADEAKKQGLPLAVHLPRGVGLAEASDAGARSIEHIEILIESSVYGKGATAKTTDEAIAENSSPAGEALFARLKKNGTWYDPTLVAFYRGFALWGGDTKKTKRRIEVYRHYLELAEAMHKAGVSILAGSDFSDWALVPGVDLHNELALMVEAGFTPMEALQTATLEPAKYLGRLNDQGTVEQGKIADLVLLDQDPLEDISHTRKINSVVVRGRFLPIARLRDQIVNSQAAAR